MQPAFVHTLYSFEMIFLLSTMLSNFELLTELKYSNWFFAAESKIYIFVWGHNFYANNSYLNQKMKIHSI